MGKCILKKKNLEQQLDDRHKDCMALQKLVTQLQNQLKRASGGGLRGGNRDSCNCESLDSVYKTIGAHHTQKLSYNTLIQMWRANVLTNWSKCAKHRSNQNTRTYSALNNIKP